MPSNQCLMPNATLREFSKKYNMPLDIVKQKADSWQLANNKNRYPTMEELKEFVDNQGKGDITVPSSIMQTFVEEFNKDNIVDVSLDGENYLVTRNGAIVRLKDMKLMMFSEDSQEYQDIFDQAAGTFSDLEGAEEEGQAKDIVHQASKKWTRKDVEKDTKTLYIFTDNLDRTSADAGKNENITSGRYFDKYHGDKKALSYGTLNNSTSANIRGLDNAFPITTQKYFHRSKEGYRGDRWTDADAEEFERTVSAEVDDIIAEWNTGKYERVMIPGGDGFFNSGIADISEKRVPELYRILNEQYNRLLSSIGSSAPNANPKANAEQGEKKGSRVLWTHESDEYKKQMEAAKEKAKGFHLMAPGGNSKSVSAWRYFGKKCGLASIVKDKDDKDKEVAIPGARYSDWFKLPFEERKRLESEYQKAVDNTNGLHRSAVKITSISEDDAKKDKKQQRAIYYRLAYKQIEECDGVYVVGQIVDPGEDYEANGTTYTNKADFAAVGETAGIFVRYATTFRDKNDHLAPKPVHVFDANRGGWFTYKDGEFVKEDTPVLTPKAFVTGTLGEKGTGSYDKVIGKENRKAIQDVYEKTFGIKMRYGSYKSVMDTRGIDVELLGKKIQEIDKKTADYDTSTDDMQVVDSPMSKLAMDIDPHTRVFRTEMIARDFSLNLWENVQRDFKDGKARKDYEKAQKAYDDFYLEVASEVQQDDETAEQFEERKKKFLGRARKGLQKHIDYMNLMEDPEISEEEKKKAVIQHYTLDGLFQQLKDNYQKRANSQRLPENIKAEYQKVVDNFDVLIQDALEKIQYLENFRVIPFKRSPRSRMEGFTTSSQQEAYWNESGIFDDEEGTRVTGNDGWSFKIRFVDPMLTVSQTTKRLLYNIPMVGENGKYLKDDIGRVRYVNGEWAHVVLMDKLSDMVDADDFCQVIERAADGTPTKFALPALERVAESYPWVRNLIEDLEDDNEAVSAFFHDFDKSYIQYCKIASDGKNMPLNAPVGQDSAFNQVVRNYENSIILSDDSIYSTGRINRESADRLGDRLRKIDDRVRHDQKYDVEEERTKAVPEVANMLRALGFEVNINYLQHRFNSLFEEGKRKKTEWDALSDDMLSIFGLISDPDSFADDDNYISMFRTRLKRIAKIVGEISELDNVQSFRQGKDSRYSYSAVNYIDKMVKAIKNDNRVEDYIEKEFGYDPWFKTEDGEWRNELLKLFTSPDTSLSTQVRENLGCTEVIALEIGDRDAGTAADIEYKDWDDAQTYSVLFSKYFGNKVKDETVGRVAGVEFENYTEYNMPIFSDSPVCMFIKLPRYTKDFKKYLLDKLVRVAEQEMDRMGLVTQRKKDGAAKIQSFDKNGGKFQFFPELNTLEMADGTLYIDALRDALSKGDLEGEKELTRAALTKVMDDLFDQFLADIEDSGLGIGGVTGQLMKIKALTQYKGETDESLYKRTREMLEEYFWNSTFATSQIIQLTTTDLAYYKNPVDFQKRFKQVYAAGNRLNTNSKYGRKIENTVYVTDHIITSSRYLGVKRVLQRAVEEGRLTNGQMEWILKGAKNINVADAQAFRNPYAFRAVLDMMGKWNKDMEESFNRLLNGEWDDKDLSIIWQSIKPFVYSLVSTDNGVKDKNSKFYGKRMRVPHQNKNSEFVVLAFYDMIAASEGDSAFLKGLGDFFASHPDVDLVQFESAVKAGGQGIVNLNYDPDTLYSYIESEDIKLKKRAEEIKEELKNKGEKAGDVPSSVRDYAIKEAKYLKLIKKDDEINKFSDYDWFKMYLDYRVDHASEFNKGKTQEESEDLEKKNYDYLMDQLELGADEIKRVLEEKIAMKDDEGNVMMDADGNPIIDIENGQFDIDVLHQLSYGDYMIAQPTPEHLMDIEDATSGSQFRNLIMANLPEDFELTLQGHTYNRQQIRDLYRGAIVDNLLDSYEKVSGMFADIHLLQRKMFRAIEGNPKFGSDIIEALQIIEIPDVKNPGQTREVFNIPLDLPTISNQVQEIITAVFRNTITKQKINGGACIQVACVGLTRELNIERDSDGNIIGAECFLPAWSKKFFTPYLVKNDHEVKIDIEKMQEECPDLLKLVGYRIPTENKYSMLPLIVKGFLPQQQGSSIMLPADITLIAGSDFDVDKMYLRIPAIDKEYYKKTGKVRKLGYDLPELGYADRATDVTSQGKMTKEQRDNLMIDIEYAILTSPIGSEQVYKPGNFDTVKRWAKINRILEDKKNKDMLINFIMEYGPSSTTDNPDKEAAREEAAAMSMDAQMVLDMFNEKDPLRDEKGNILKDKNGKELKGDFKITLDDLNDFLDNYDSGRNSLTPQNYVYFHRQNMVGASLIGVYANGSSMHTKAQETDLRIDDNSAFKVNGVLHTSLHDQRRKTINEDGKEVEAEYIQDIIAEFQGASVDNAKEPALADLQQSMRTAGTTLFMARSGMSIEEISLMFNAYRHGALPFNDIMGVISEVFATYHIKDPMVLEDIPEITSVEMLQTQMYMRKYQSLYRSMFGFDPTNKSAVGELYAQIEKSGIGEYELVDMLKHVAKYSRIYECINDLKKELKPMNDIMKADSPNNALAVNFPGAILQRRAVDIAMKKLYKSSFRGSSDDRVDTIKEFIRNDVILSTDSRAAMKRKLMEEKLPMVQGFYSLGIELPINVMKDFFVQGNDELMTLAFTLMDDMDSGTMTERQINDFYREFMQFVLSGTETFGDSSTESFDVKRRYYLYHFPKTFLKKAKGIKELRENPTVRKMIVKGDKYPVISLPRTGKMTPTMKASMRRDLNSLLYSSNPHVVKFGKDLFLYSFFHNGFNFKGDSFGTYFDATFWNSFPEVVEMLRNFRYEGKEAGLIGKFRDMYLANHAQEPMIKTYLSKQQDPKFNEDGTVTLRRGNCFTDYSGGPVRYIRVKREKGALDYRIYELDASSVKKGQDADSELTYAPLPVFDEPDKVYNASSTVKKMEGVYWNDRVRIIDEMKKAEEEEREALKKVSSSEVDENDGQDNDDSPTSGSIAENNSETAGRPKADEDSRRADAAAASDPTAAQDNRDEANAALAADVRGAEDPFINDATAAKAEEILNNPESRAAMNKAYLEKVAGVSLSQEEVDKMEKLIKEMQETRKKQNPC